MTLVNWPVRFGVGHLPCRSPAVFTGTVPDREELPLDADDVERLVRLGPKELTWPEVCARAGISHEVADPLWRALGFPDIPPDERAYTSGRRTGPGNRGRGHRIAPR